MTIVSLVTGGRTGIGLGIAKELVKRGQKVYVTSRSKGDVSVDGIELIHCDATTSEGVGYLLRYMTERNLKVQVLVNNIGHTLSIVDPFCDIANWEKVFSVNLYGAIRTTNAFVPLMAELEYARLINIASNAGIENSGPVTFTTTKAALVAYTRSIGRVLATKYPNVVANAVLPGVVITPEGHWQEIISSSPERAEKYLAERCPLGRFGEIDEISSFVGYLSSKQNSFSHGSIIPLDGGQAKGLLTYSYLD